MAYDDTKVAGNTIGSADWNAFVDVVTKDKVFYAPRYGAIGDGVTDDTAAVQSAIDAAEVSGGNVFFAPGTYKLSDDVTADKNITITMAPGAKFSVDTTKTLTLNCHIDAGPHQIFSGAGDIAGSPRNDFVRPEWWGAVADGATDDATAIDKAITFSNTSGIKTTQLQGRNYYVASALSYSTLSGITVLGSAGKSAGTTITYDGIATGTNALTFTNCDFLRIENIYFTTNGTKAKSGLCLKDGCSDGTFVNCYFNDFTTAGIYIDSTNTSVFYHQFIGCRSYSSNYGVLQDGGGSNSIQFIGGRYASNDTAGIAIRGQNHLFDGVDLESNPVGLTTTNGEAFTSRAWTVKNIYLENMGSDPAIYIANLHYSTFGPMFVSSGYNELEFGGDNLHNTIINWMGDVKFTAVTCRNNTIINVTGTITDDGVNNMIMAPLRTYDVRHYLYGARGDGVTDDTAAVQSAIDAAEVSGGNVFFAPGTYKLSDDVTADKNITITMAPGAKFSVDTTKTLTLNCHIDAGPHQIFDGAGDIAGEPRNECVYTEWWGAVADGTTDCAQAFRDAVAFAYASKVGKLKLLAGEYLIQSALEFYGIDEILLEGSAPALYAPNRIAGTEIILDGIGNATHGISLSINGVDNSGVDNKLTSMTDTTKNFVELGVAVNDDIINITKHGSPEPSGNITSITTRTNTNDTVNFSGGLGGAADFDNGDRYVIKPNARGPRGWVFRDLKITASGAAARSGIFLPWNVAECRFENVDVRGFHQASLRLDTAFSCTFINCKFNSSGAGVYGYAGQQNSFIGCWLTANTYAGAIVSGQNYTFLACDMEGQPRSIDMSYAPTGAPAGLYLTSDRVVSSGWLISSIYMESMTESVVMNLTLLDDSVIGPVYITGANDALTLASSDDNSVLSWDGDISASGNAARNKVLHATGMVYDSVGGIDLGSNQWFKLAHTAPVLELKNTTEEDADGGREGVITFRGEQSGGELSTLVKIEGSHDGAGDDQKGKLTISVNDGDDGDSPSVIGLEIDSAGNLKVVGTTKTNIFDLPEISEPATPATNDLRLYTEAIHGFSFFKYLDDTGMKREIVRDSMILVKNIRGTSIAANRIVYATGSEDNVPTVDLAKADSLSTLPAIGVTIEAIANGAFGRVMQVGLLEDINTSALNVGDILYVSDVTAGVPVTTAPATPSLTQEIGTCLVSDASAGAIQIVARGIDGNEYGTIQSSFTVHNLTEEDIDGGRESVLGFRGEQSGGEISTLGQVKGSHDGAADDEKGKLEFLVNDGNDGDSPSIVGLEIDSTGKNALLSATIGGGTEIKKVECGTVAIDPPSIASVSRGTATGTITGAASGDRIIMEPPSALNDDLLFVGAVISGANTVTVYLYNPTGGAIDDASQTWNYTWLDLT